MSDYSAPDAEGHAALRRVFIKHGFNPDSPVLKPIILDLEKAYTNDLNKARIHICDNIPGFRSIILLGWGLLQNCIKGDPLRDTGICAIKNDGRLVRSMFNIGTEEDNNCLKILFGINEAQSSFKNILQMRLNKEGIQGFTLDLSEFDHVKHAFHQKYLLFTESCISCNRHTGVFGKEMEKELLNNLTACVNIHFYSIRNKFRNALDPDVQHIMKEYGMSDIKDVYWLTGGDGVSREIIQARRQAIRTYPVFSNFLFEMEDLLEAIDARTSLKTAIARRYRVDESRVKRLLGLNQSHYYNGISNGMISEILHLPEAAVPKTVTDFENLQVMREFGSSLYGESLTKFMWRWSETGNPLRLIDRIKQTNGPNVSDAVNFLAAKLFIPAGLNRIKDLISDQKPDDQQFDMENIEHYARHDIVTLFSPRELLDLSDRYHRNIARYENLLNIISMEQDWTGMFGTINFGNGYMARELTSAREFKKQGRNQNHCVGGYVSRVFNGDLYSENELTIIFSIEKNGECMSTAEIKIRAVQENQKDLNCKYVLRGQIQQNSARSNAIPSEQANLMAGNIADHVSKTGSEAFFRYTRDLKQTRREFNQLSKLSKYEKICGFDPYDRACLNLAWEELASSLPRRLRQGGLDGFISNSDLNQDLIRTSAITDEIREPNDADDLPLIEL